MCGLPIQKARADANYQWSHVPNADPKTLSRIVNCLIDNHATGVQPSLSDYVNMLNGKQV